MGRDLEPSRAGGSRTEMISSPDLVLAVRGQKRGKNLLNRSRTRAEKSLAQQQYSQAHKEVRRSANQDKLKYTEELAR